MKHIALFTALSLLAVAGPASALPVFDVSGSTIDPSTGEYAPDGDGGWAPGTMGPPPAPTVLTITDRGRDAISLVFNDPSGEEDSYTLKRQGPDGRWRAVQTWGPRAGWTGYTDAGLAADTRYCYRVLATNENGNALSPERCAYTRPARAVSVYRAQLEVQVGTERDAGTDDAIQVMLNAHDGKTVPAGTHTWMDYGIDDFEYASVKRYDLGLTTVDEMGDITLLALKLDGDDAVCLQSFALILDGVEVFRRSYGACHWLTAAEPVVAVPHAELRADPAWQAYTGPSAIKLRFEHEELVSRLESAFGHAMHATPELYWGTRRGTAHLEIDQVDFGTMHVTADLEVDPRLLPSARLDVAFDIGVSITCDRQAETIELAFEGTQAEASADFNGFARLLDILPLDEYVEAQVEAGLGNVSSAFSVHAPAYFSSIGADGTCPSVEVRPDGDVVIDLYGG